jgi:hypothetical protein
VFPKDVYRIFDRLVRPPAPKRHICVCPEQRHFLRINSQPIWKPNRLIFAATCDFLDHDSYVELNAMIRLHGDDVAGAVRLGRLSPPVAQDVMSAVEDAETIPQRHKDLIRDRWGF